MKIFFKHDYLKNMRDYVPQKDEPVYIIDKKNADEYNEIVENTRNDQQRARSDKADCSVRL